MKMVQQKIVTAYIDINDGTKALQQIRDVAGPGDWKIVSVTNLHYIQMAKQRWAGTHDPRQEGGELVLVVLEVVR